VGTGLGVLGSLLDADVDRLVGPKGRHNRQRAAVRHGTQPGKVTLGGRRIQVDRPRVRRADGTHELPLPTWQVFASTQLLDQLALERMLAKLSTRRYRVGLEPVGSQVEQTATGTSRSAVSRRFVAATEQALAELLAADLSALDLVALLVDGIRVAEHTCVVALGITLDGTKVPLALAEGATENTTVVRDLLAGLRDRGLDVTRPILVVIDGAKALRRAVTEVFDHPVIQRCQLHKLRNVSDRLPDTLASVVAKRIRRAYHHADPLVAQAELEALARELDRSHPGAAASLREGLAETLTIGRLGVPPTLARTLRSTNTIESMIEICRDHAANVKHWQDGQMVLRWIAAGMARPPSSSAASTATYTCQPCAPPWTPPSPLSHRPRRMPPPDHPGPPPKFHGGRDILWHRQVHETRAIPSSYPAPLAAAPPGLHTVMICASGRCAIHRCSTGRCTPRSTRVG
jgi:putative transposase